MKKTQRHYNIFNSTCVIHLAQTKLRKYITNYSLINLIVFHTVDSVVYFPPPLGFVIAPSAAVYPNSLLCILLNTDHELVVFVHNAVHVGDVPGLHYSMNIN